MDLNNQAKQLIDIAKNNFNTAKYYAGWIDLCDSSDDLTHYAIKICISEGLRYRELNQKLSIKIPNSIQSDESWDGKTYADYRREAYNQEIDPNLFQEAIAEYLINEKTDKLDIIREKRDEIKGRFPDPSKVTIPEEENNPEPNDDGP